MKNNILRLAIIMGLALILIFAFIGCAPEEAPVDEEPEDAVEPDPEPDEELETMELSFSTWHVPASAECTSVWDPMLEELEARSDGRITATTYYGGALGAGPDHFDIVADGLSDMGYFTATWTPGRFPLSDVLSMPVFVGGKDVAVDIGNAMYENILYPEFEEVKLLNLNGCIQSYFWTTEAVETLEDVEGLRMRSPGGLQTYMIEALGAEPVFMPLGDVYMAMELGDIDGIVTCPQLYYAFSLFEVANHAVVASFGCVTEGVAMNLDSYESAPDDLRAIIDEVTENPFKLTGGLTVETIQGIMDSLVDEGVIFYELPEAEAERWNSLFAEEVVIKWVEQMEADGLPGKEALLLYKEELDKHGVEFPAFPEEWE